MRLVRVLLALMLLAGVASAGTGEWEMGRPDGLLSVYRDTAGVDFDIPAWLVADGGWLFLETAGALTLTLPEPVEGHSVCIMVILNVAIPTITVTNATDNIFLNGVEIAGASPDIVPTVPALADSVCFVADDSKQWWTYDVIPAGGWS
jgi:hypothetical protein